MAPLDLDAERAAMVEWQLRRRGIRDSRVLGAMLRVPRHLFVPSESRAQAYQDHPQSLPAGQTISQPYMVARMTELLSLKGDERVLEIGTGSGYQTAVLAVLSGQVYSLERHAVLADQARATLTELGYANVTVEVRDGSQGLPEEAPFDAILVTAGAPAAPQALVSQLAEGGRLVVPVGPAERQELTVVTRKDDQVLCERLDACVFVPLVGAEGWPETA
ncbi:MAG TPA: protein-L-isoaspartate(D-aspartate) O-methyltransferase [Armatimonadota bacterium]|jgi:protein-L-isoaspartate(D-aspartate) O-methyltransferase